MGSTNNDYGMLIAADPAEAHPYALTGSSSSIIPNRVSYALDLRGPSVNVDTACSSSLVAIHQAVRGLREGDADVALAGGVNIQARSEERRVGKEGRARGAVRDNKSNSDREGTAGETTTR